MASLIAIKYGIDKKDFEVFILQNQLEHEGVFDFITDDSLVEEYVKRYLSKSVGSSDNKVHEKVKTRPLDTQKGEEALLALKGNHAEGYWEYMAIDIPDKKGRINIGELNKRINDLGTQGWRLRCAYTNEVGKRGLSLFGLGLNSTVDQNVLIFERFVSFPQEGVR